MSADFVRGVLYVLDIPQKAIADRANIDQGTLSKYLNGVRPIPEGHLASILMVVGELKAERLRSAVCQAA